MRKSSAQIWFATAVLTLALLAAGALGLLNEQCSATGGRFHWSTAACERSHGPILQGDIHRV